MEKLRILIIRFKNEILPWEIPLFRGAINNSMGKADILFHNHNEDDTLRYSYPLIQYKRLHKKASIICVNEGTDAMGQFFSEHSPNFKLADKEMELEVESVHASRFVMQLWENQFSYNLRSWLPLNSKNYAEYMKMDSLVEKYSLLERTLTGNILSMAKSIGLFFDKKVEVKITKVEELHTAIYKGVKMQAFDVEFKSNVSLPNYVGLGKGASMGFGTVSMKHGKNEIEDLFKIDGNNQVV